MSTYRVAIIGTGRVGYQFSFFPTCPTTTPLPLSQTSLCELVAGVNRGREKARCLRASASAWRCSTTTIGKCSPRSNPTSASSPPHPELHAEMVTSCAPAPPRREPSSAKKPDGSLAGRMRPDDRGPAKQGMCFCRSTTTAAGTPSGVLAKTLLDEGAIGELNHIYCYMDGGKPAPLVAQRERRSLTARFHPLFRPDGSLRSAKWIGCAAWLNSACALGLSRIFRQLCSNSKGGPLG